MSTENTPVETVTDDLDAFAAELFGQSKAAPEAATSEADEDVTDQDEDALENTQTDDDTVETEDEVEDVEGEETPEPEKPKKNRFQERIDELTAKAREAERRAEEAERKLTEKQPPKNEPTVPAVEQTGPSVEDKNEDGTDKYPLGEFDPQYIRDLTKHTLREEREQIKAEEARADQEKAFEAERNALQESWREKLVPAQERYPDFQEKGEALTDTFAGIDQKYGEYLQATLMSMDYGPDVLYYLANNVDEAQKIVDSGPTKATIALGRLEAKFAVAEAEKQLARPKVSKAPAPPATLKGASAVLADIPDDTDDLDAFSKKLFSKKR